MIVVKGILLVFVLFIITTVLFLVLARGAMFPATWLQKIGPFLIGCGIGSTAIGLGFVFLSRIMLARLMHAPR